MNKDYKTAIINMFKNLNEDMLINKWNVRKFLKDQMAFMELKKYKYLKWKTSALQKKYYEEKRQAINWEKNTCKTCIW